MEYLYFKAVTYEIYHKQKYLFVRKKIIFYLLLECNTLNKLVQV